MSSPNRHLALAYSSSMIFFRKPVSVRDQVRGKLFRDHALPQMQSRMSDDLPAHMRPQRSFQGLILALERYWADYGCVILQPYDMEVGAGTFHPATTLRALGPKPWHAAYVQPSRRPKDGRYGENP